MDKGLIEQLYENRLLRTREEFEKFEEGLNILSEVIQENDIFELCSVFDDNTMDEEVMFGLIHLIELFSSEKAFEFTVLGVSNMKGNAVNWAKIIIYRCLNDDFSRKMLKKAINKVDSKTKQLVYLLLNSIKKEDYNKFGELIDDVID